MIMPSDQLSPEDLEDLSYAKSLLENPTLGARIANAVGSPIEKGLELLPKGATKVISAATMKSLQVALSFAVSTMGERQQHSGNRIHKTMVAMTGATAGAFGLSALAVELPISTTIMLRSIADIARSEGERIKSLESRLACLEVFALGGRARGDNAAESGYFAVRVALAKAMTEAAEYIAERGVAKGAAPPLVRFLTQIAARFGIPVTEKAVAQSLPIVGAAGGALINTLFIDHFQDMARGHFIVRRLERGYGPELVRREYQKLPAK